MGKKPFIDRKTARHYKLVYRSQRDPLINDEDAPSRVFVEVTPPNLRVTFFFLKGFLYCVCISKVYNICI